MNVYNSANLVLSFLANFTVRFLCSTIVAAVVVVVLLMVLATLLFCCFVKRKKTKTLPRDQPALGTPSLRWLYILYYCGFYGFYYFILFHQYSTVLKTLKDIERNLAFCPSKPPPPHPPPFSANTARKAKLFSSRAFLCVADEACLC